MGLSYDRLVLCVINKMFCNQVQLLIYSRIDVISLNRVRLIHARQCQIDLDYADFNLNPAVG